MFTCVSALVVSRRIGNRGESGGESPDDVSSEDVGFSFTTQVRLVCPLILQRLHLLWFPALQPYSSHTWHWLVMTSSCTLTFTTSKQTETVLAVKTPVSRVSAPWTFANCSESTQQRTFFFTYIVYLISSNSTCKLQLNRTLGSKDTIDFPLWPSRQLWPGTSTLWHHILVLIQETLVRSN